MNVAIKTEQTSIVTLVNANPVVVLTDAVKYSQFYEEMKRETDAHVPDLSTKKGRDAIAALAFKVTRTKTAIDAAGKKLNEEARAQINKVDASRREIREQLDALATSVRKPLTDWEDAEGARIENCKATIAHIVECGKGMIGGEPQAFGILFRELQEKIVIDASFGEFEQEALRAKEASLERLNIAFEQHKRAEADRLELERLRAEAAERDRIAAEKAAKEEAERQAKARAEAEEARRIAEEKAAKERIAAAEERARQQAVADAECKAREEREALERQHTAALKAEQDKAAELERQRLAKAAEEKRLADEQAAREANQAHRTKIKSAAKAALMTCGVDDETAKKIVLAIIANEIPNVSIRF